MIFTMTLQQVDLLKGESDVVGEILERVTKAINDLNLALVTPRLFIITKPGIIFPSFLEKRYADRQERGQQPH